MSCPVCFEEEPTAFHGIKPCGHSCCLPCLQQWFEACERMGRSEPTCPTCRKPVDIQHEAPLVLGRPFEPAGLTTPRPPQEEMDELTQHYMSSVAKACRSCGAWIEKSDGCYKMQCLCGYRFCWNCESQGSSCDCTPRNHVFWDNVLHCNAYGQARVATPEETQDLRSFWEERVVVARRQLEEARRQRKEDWIRRVKELRQRRYMKKTIVLIKRENLEAASLMYSKAKRLARGSTPVWAKELRPLVSSMNRVDVEELFPGVEGGRYVTMVTPNTKCSVLSIAS